MDPSTAAGGTIRQVIACDRSESRLRPAAPEMCAIVVPCPPAVLAREISAASDEEETDRYSESVSLEPFQSVLASAVRRSSTSPLSRISLVKLAAGLLPDGRMHVFPPPWSVTVSAPLD